MTKVRVDHDGESTRVWLGDEEITDLVDEVSFYGDGDVRGHRIRLDLEVDADAIARVEAVSGLVRWDGLDSIPAEALVWELKRRRRHDPVAARLIADLVEPGRG